MTTVNDFKLDNIDPEDFEDTLLKIEKSFGINFAENSFKKIKTFGDICTIVESQMSFAEKNDCTTQQAFYKVRKAIALTHTLNEKSITPQTKLEEIFPRSNRRKNIKQFQQSLGFSVNILSMKNWLGWTIAIGFILSFIAFFFNWQYAVFGLTVFTLLMYTVSSFSKELAVSTVAELTEKISREHYLLARRQNGTVNKKEIVKTIQDVFIADYLIQREHLTKEASVITA